MAWKCPECGEIVKDDSLIRCVCGYEIKEDEEIEEYVEAIPTDEIDAKTHGDMPKKAKAVVKGFQVFGILSGLLSLLFMGILLFYSSDIDRELAIKAISYLIIAIVYCLVFLFTAKLIFDSKCLVKSLSA